MKCVILVAGEGKRMRPLTLKTPKPLLKVKGKPIIDYIFDALPEEIDEVIIVVKYLGEQIKEHVDGNYGFCQVCSDEGGNRERKIRYVQGSDKSNVYSFLATKKYLKNERFLLIYGDEIPRPENIKRCLEKDLSILTYVCPLCHDSTYDGVMVLNTNIFRYEPPSGLFKDLVKDFAEENEVSLVEAENFVGGINTPSDLIRVEKELDKIYG